MKRVPWCRKTALWKKIIKRFVHQNYIVLTGLTSVMQCLTKSVEVTYAEVETNLQLSLKNLRFAHVIVELIIL